MGVKVWIKYHLYCSENDEISLTFAHQISSFLLQYLYYVHMYMYMYPKYYATCMTDAKSLFLFSHIMLMNSQSQSHQDSAPSHMPALPCPVLIEKALQHHQLKLAVSHQSPKQNTNTC